jgi:hypothetical protein
MQPRVKHVGYTGFLARRNPQSGLVLVVIFDSIRCALRRYFPGGAFILALDLRLSIIHGKRRDKINKRRLEFKLAAINLVGVHPTGDSRFKTLGAAPRQRASGLPRTTPRSPFLKPIASGVHGHSGVYATNRPVDRILNNQGRGGCSGSVLWSVFLTSVARSRFRGSTTSCDGGHVRGKTLRIALFP